MKQPPITNKSDIDNKLPFLKVLAFYYKPTTASSATDIQTDVFNPAILDNNIDKKLITRTANLLDEIKSSADYNKETNKS